MRIKLFEEHSQDHIGIIRDTFESIFDDDISLDFQISNVTEDIIHLNESLWYIRGDGKESRSELFYRYGCVHKKHEWDLSSDGYCYIDEYGYLLSEFTIDKLRTKISTMEAKVKETPYYLVEIMSSDKVKFIKKWSTIYPSIREAVDILRSYDIVLHECGSLFFKNGIESFYQNRFNFQVWDWGVDIQPGASDMYGRFGIQSGEDERLNICLKSI